MTTENQTTMPEKAFLKSLDSLETLAKGMISVGDEVNDEELGKAVTEDLEKCAGADLTKADEGGDADDADEKDEDNDIEKGLSDDPDPETFGEELAASSENIQKAIEVSDFLADLVDRVSEAIDNIRVSTSARFEAMEKSLTKAVQVNQDMVLSVTETLRKSYQAVSEKTDQQADDLRKSLDTLNTELSRTPARGPKTRTHVLNKSFDDDGAKEMTKEDILKSLTNMFEKGDPNVTSMDIIRFESGGSLTPHVRQVLGLG